jgi:hypothetical protein
LVSKTCFVGKSICYCDGKQETIEEYQSKSKKILAESQAFACRILNFEEEFRETLKDLMKCVAKQVIMQIA